MMIYLRKGAAFLVLAEEMPDDDLSEDGVALLVLAEELHG